MMTAKNDHDDNHIHRKVSFYAIPRQRQRWGDHQVHPHTNWADTFFDLFYVAAYVFYSSCRFAQLSCDARAYKLGNLLREDPTTAGLLYAAGLFFPIQNLWTLKMYYDSRFYYQKDYFHGIYEIAVLLTLASTVLSIRSVSILSDPVGRPEMFRFSLSILIAYVLSLGRLLEVAAAQKFSKGQTGLFPESLAASLRDSFSVALSIGFLLAATIYAGLSNLNGSSSIYVNSDETEELHRLLAEAADSASKSSYQSDDIPIWLLLGSTLVSFVLFVTKMVVYSSSAVDHKQFSVPMNIDFAIHRYGEWTMLMLGETVLSLLIVDIVVTPGYFVTFLGGIVSIVLLEYLHFQSQPSDPDKHAYRRSLLSSMTFYWLMQVYSMALIVYGASFKMLLYEQLYKKNDARRNLLGRLAERFLAGGESAALRFSADDRQQRISHFFALSLAVVFFCMDVILLAHRGVRANLDRCSGNRCTKKKKLLSFSHVLCRVAILGFTATLSQYYTSPDYLALVGLGTIVAQLCLRVFASVLFFHDSTEDEEQAIQRAIEYNTARIHTSQRAEDSIPQPPH